MTPEAEVKPLRRFRVEEKDRKRWAYTVRARDEEHARMLAKECGFTEPATATEITP